MMEQIRLFSQANIKNTQIMEVQIQIEESIKSTPHKNQIN